MKNFTKKQVEKFKKNRHIKLSRNQFCSLYFLNMFKVCMYNRDNLLWRLYEDGQGRLEKEFDIVRIIRNIRNMKIFLKTTIMNKQTQVMLQNQKSNIIDIDSSTVTSESESNSEYSDEDVVEKNIKYHDGRRKQILNDNLLDRVRK